MGNNLAPIIEELRRAYVELKHDVFDVKLPIGEYEDGKYVSKPVDMPMPVITIQARGRKNVDGWYKNTAWDSQTAEALNVLAGKNKTIASTDEICIAAEAIGKPVNDIMVILCHQMIHHYDKCRMEKDGWTTSEQTQTKSGYHTKRFEALALTVGLNVALDKSGGYRLTSIDPSSPLQQVFDKIALSQQVFDMHRKGLDPTDKKFVGSKLKKWSCDCTNIRSAVYLEATCEMCKKPFVYTDKDKDSTSIESWLTAAKQIADWNEARNGERRR